MNKLYTVLANQKRESGPEETFTLSEGLREETFTLSEGLRLDVSTLTCMRSFNWMVDRQDDRIEKSLGESV